MKKIIFLVAIIPLLIFVGHALADSYFPLNSLPTEIPLFQVDLEGYRLVGPVYLRQGDCYGMPMPALLVDDWNGMILIPLSYFQYREAQLCRHQYHFSARRLNSSNWYDKMLIDEYSRLEW